MATTIFLVGFMGCGKTTLGEALARVMRLPFIDLDDYIAHKMSMSSVQQIFATAGEAAFRRAECDALREVAAAGAVVATGGGTPCQAGNMELMNECGVTVWLTTSPGVITRRLLIPEQRAKRPLLNGLTDAEVGRLVREKLKAREPYYSRATLWFDSTDIETAEATLATASLLAARLGCVALVGNDGTAGL